MWIALFCAFGVLAVAETKTFSLEEINLEKMRTTKMVSNSPGENRSVYYDPISNCYFKIWEKEYQQKESFTRAFNEGFYEGLAPLIGIIRDKEQIVRGYVTKHLKPAQYLAFFIQSDGYKTLQDMEKQPKIAQQFFQTLMEQSKSKGFYYLDLVPSNLVTDGKAVYLVDLESVYTREQLVRYFWTSKNKFLETLYHLPPRYAAYLQHDLEMIEPRFLELAWVIPTGGSHGKSYYSLEIGDRFFPGERSWNVRWKLLQHAMDYKNKRILDIGCNTGIASIFLMKYGNAASYLGVDRPDELLAQVGMPYLMEAASYLHQGFQVPMNITQIDLNHSSYEKILGEDHDVVLCMSILKWIDDKERFLRYLSKFGHILFEGHDPDLIEIERFAKFGFSHEILGQTQVGVSYSPNSTRTLIHFYRE